MTETLLLRMPEAGRPANWLVVDAFGNRMGQVQGGTLAEAGPFAAGRRVRVYVPGSAVTLFHVAIPSHNLHKILQAAPFALEDKLAEDVETLHFAVGRRAGNAYPIAVVARARMRQWLDELAAAGLKPAEIIPDMLALPTRDNTLIVVQDGEHLLARFPDGTALAAETSLMPLLIQRYQAMLEETLRCTHALIHAPDETAVQAITHTLGDLHMEPAYRPLNGDAITLMAVTAQNAWTIDLLQGEFRLHGGMNEHWQHWRTAAMLLIALCTAVIAQQGVSYFRLRHEAASLDTQVATLFHAALPDVHRMVRPRAQMQQRLSQLTGGNGNTDGPLRILMAVGNALQSQSGVQLQGFSYHGGTLQLQLQASGIDALNNVKSVLARNTAFSVNLDSVNSGAGQTTGRLTISGSGA